MGYDTHAKILVKTTAIGGDGSPAPSFTEVGSVYLERVNLSARQTVTAQREAAALEEVFRARPHSKLVLGVHLVLPDGVRREVSRVDPIGRRQGAVIYLTRIVAG